MQLRAWTTWSIKQKITVAYILFILIPFTLLSVHSYIQTKTIQKEQMAGNLKQTLTVVQSSIEGKLNLVESISHNITYNTRLQSFLDETFQNQSGSMEMYSQIINPIVHYGLVYNQVMINDIKVYMNNHSIPEGFGSFYHDTAVIGQSWYNSFLKSNKRSHWVSISENSTYVYLQKIISMEGKFLGVTAVTLLKQDLFNSLKDFSVGGSNVFVLDTNDRLIYGKAEAFILPNVNPANISEVEDNGKLFVVSDLDQLNMKIGISEAFSKTQQSMQLLTTIGFISAIVLSIFLFYRVLKTTFVKIKSSIRAMDRSIRNGFTEWIPVDRNDEIGVISEKFNTLLNQIHILVGDMIKRETVHKDAQLKALQAQINPHFIYNTINLFSAKTELAGLYDVSEAIADFGQILRYNMKDQTEYATIKQEINHVLNYIRLQKLKYEDRLKILWTCDDSLLPYPMLRFVLQPVVENSIIHGMPNERELIISMHVCRLNHNLLEITISDNGTGVTEARLSELNQYFQFSGDRNNVSSTLIATGNSTGIGLGNINERLKLFYGNTFTIRMSSVVGYNTTTKLTIPFRDYNGDELTNESINRG